MIMVLYFVEQIEDEHSKFGFSNVPRIYKKRVREQLILHGNEHLAIEGVTNYVGPRPKFDVYKIMEQAERDFYAAEEDKKKEQEETAKKQEETTAKP